MHHQMTRYAIMTYPWQQGCTACRLVFFYGRSTIGAELAMFSRLRGVSEGGTRKQNPRRSSSSHRVCAYSIYNRGVSPRPCHPKTREASNGKMGCFDKSLGFAVHFFLILLFHSCSFIMIETPLDTSIVSGHRPKVRDKPTLDRLLL